MKLHPNVGLIWEREIIDQDYVVVDHDQTSSKEENVLKTRASTYQKLIDNPASDCPAYEISPTGWDVIRGESPQGQAGAMASPEFTIYTILCPYLQ